MSGRLVAASTTTASEDSKPSSSVRIWSSVCSRSSFAPLIAVWHPPAEAAVSLGTSQEVHDLREFSLRLVDAGDVVEGDADRLGVDAARLRTAEVPERPHPACSFGGSPGEQHEQPDDQQG